MIVNQPVPGGLFRNIRGQPSWLRRRYARGSQAPPILPSKPTDRANQLDGKFVFTIGQALCPTRRRSGPNPKSVPRGTGVYQLVAAHPKNRLLATSACPEHALGDHRPRSRAGYTAWKPLIRFVAARQSRRTIRAPTPFPPKASNSVEVANRAGTALIVRLRMAVVRARTHFGHTGHTSCSYRCQACDIPPHRRHHMANW